MCSTIPYPQYARINRQDDPMGSNHRSVVMSSSNSNSPPGGRDDARRAEEALAAIPGRFDRLLTCAQLSHARSTRGSSARTIPWVPNHSFVTRSRSTVTSRRVHCRRFTAGHSGFGGHSRAVRPSPDMCSTITYPQYARINRQDDPYGSEPPFRCALRIRIRIRLRADETVYGEPLRLWRPSQGGSTVS